MRASLGNKCRVKQFKQGTEADRLLQYILTPNEVLIFLRVPPQPTFVFVGRPGKDYQVLLQSFFSVELDLEISKSFSVLFTVLVFLSFLQLNWTLIFDQKRNQRSPRP